MNEEKEKLKERDKNNKDKENSSEEEDNIDTDNNPIKDEEIKNLLNKEKTIICTKEVENSLLINEKIKKIRNMKLDSDNLLKNKNYEEAINSYKSTINILLENFNEDEEVNIPIINNLKEEIIIPCYLNISLCHLKLQNWLKMKTYSKKVLELDSNNIKASCRLCLANIKLGHLKKADNQLEDLERKIGGTPELEELEQIYSKNKLNSDGNNDEFLKKMGKKLTDGKINMYSDKKTKIEIEKIKDKKDSWCFSKTKGCIRYIMNCCKKKKKKVKTK